MNHPHRRITTMYWDGQDGKGWKATGSGAGWGGGADKGYGAAFGKGDCWGSPKGKPWGSGKGDAWGGAWSLGKADAWDGGKDAHWGGKWDGSDAWNGSDAWDSGYWGKGRGSKNKKEKNYQNCTYLGMGRHRLPHEDRCALASLTLDLIFEDTGVQIPNIAVASWRERSCNAFFYLLANAQPSTRIQQMVPRGDKFIMEAAAEGLIQMWKVLIREPAERVKQANQILQWCVEDQEKMVVQATKKGMQDVEDAVPGAPFSGSGVATMPNTTGTRPLVRSDTNDEFERMKKKRHMADESRFGRDAGKNGLW